MTIPWIIFCYVKWGQLGNGGENHLHSGNKTNAQILLTTVYLFIPTKENKMVSKGQFTN